MAMSETESVETGRRQAFAWLDGIRVSYIRFVDWCTGRPAALYQVERVLHVVAVVLTLYVLVEGITTVWSLDVNQCNQIDRNHVSEVRGLILAGAALGGALIGRFLARLRFEVRGKLNGVQPQTNPPAWIHACLFAFLVVATLLLGYETWAEMNFSSPPPITSYVRCAAYYHTIVAPLTAGGVGLLLGNWLWYPTT
jgi:hypothetical protein